MEELSLTDLVVIRKSLYAYMEHLKPSAMHVREVSEWLEKVSEAEGKITRLILSRPPT